MVYEHLQSPDVFGASNRAALFSLVHSLVLPPAPPFLSSSSSSLHDPAHPSEEGDPAEFSASSFPSQAPSSFASSASSFVSYQSLTDITRSTALCKRLLQGSLCQIEQPGVAAAAVQVCGRFVRASLEVGRDPVSRKPPSKHREILEESNSQKSLISRLLKDSERELQESDEEESFHVRDESLFSSSLGVSFPVPRLGLFFLAEVLGRSPRRNLPIRLCSPNPAVVYLYLYTGLGIAF